MTPLERNRLVVALTTNGFHAEFAAPGNWVAADATYAPGRCWVTIATGTDEFLAATSLSEVGPALSAEGFERISEDGAPSGALGVFRVKGEPALHALVRRMYQLGRALPTVPLAVFRARTKNLPSSTEAERLIIQRVGQDIFREALLDYWSGRCAVTDVDQPELLRASHCKPWAKSSDSERLDVHNGLLLVADVDAAFDSGLISFNDDGTVILSSQLRETARSRLASLQIASQRLLTPTHREYLAWHRRYEFRN